MRPFDSLAQIDTAEQANESFAVVGAKHVRERPPDPSD
jgi:hypothetical protein